MPDSVNYPLTAIRFEVTWHGSNGSFSEIGGLDVETDMIEYRGGLDTSLTTRKLPGLMKYSNITLSRGVLKGDNDFFDWWTLNQQGKHDSGKDLIIKLNDESGSTTVQWTALRAWPVKVEGPSLNASGNEVAVEKLEVCHEGLTIKNG